MTGARHAGGAARAEMLCVAVACAVTAVACMWAAGCGGASSSASTTASSLPAVLADTSFMADIVENVAGGRVAVSSLIPVGADPHSFEPTPQDAKRVADSRAVVINIAGLEPMVDDLIAGAGGPDLLVVQAAAGLPGASEDPHVWLDPILVLTYVDNIRQGLTAIDPAGADTYARNAEAYKERLRELDAWIAVQVTAIPPERRLLVTNHETLAYFAKRYGFKIVGAIFPTVAGEGSPSAQQLAALVKEIRATGTPAIFLETGSNAELAEQVERETGAKVVTGLYTHSLGDNASTYLDMMRWDVKLIVEALR